MNKEEIKVILLNCFKINGIDIDYINNETNLATYIPDSLMFLSIVVTIEESFNIRLPDELLLSEAFTKSEILINAIAELTH